MGLDFYSLSIIPEPPDFIVGRIDINSYAAFPEDGVELLKQLQAGASPQKTVTWYEQHYGEPIDIADFLQALRDLQLIRKESEARVDPVPTQPVAWIIYVALLSYCAYLMLRFPSLRPTYHHVFSTSSYTVLELGLFLGQIPLLLLLEDYHLLAGRRLGLPTGLSTDRRFYFLVFESHLYGLWSVPRKQRYPPFLAGMLADVLCFAWLTIIASVATPSSLLGAFCLALATTILHFLWQFYFYLQTDIYYVFATVLRCINLQQATGYSLKSRLRRLLGHGNIRQDGEEWHPRDLQIARWHAPFFVLGSLFSSGTLLFIGLPMTWQVMMGSMSHLLRGIMFGAGFWDACLFLVSNGFQLILVLTIFLCERHKRQAY